MNNGTIPPACEGTYFVGPWFECLHERNYAELCSVFWGTLQVCCPFAFCLLGCIPSALTEVVVEESAVVSQSWWGGMPACQPASQFMLRRNSLSYSFGCDELTYVAAYQSCCPHQPYAAGTNKSSPILLLPILRRLSLPIILEKALSALFEE